MTWFIKRKLDRIARQGNPDPRFVNALETRLKRELGHPVLWIKWSKWATASFSVLALAGSGTGVYAYESDEVLPDHPLYAVKQTIENVEERVAVTPTAKAQVRLKKLERRLNENRIMQERRKPLPEKRLEAIEQGVMDLIDDAEKLPVRQQKAIDRAIERIEERHQEIVERAQARVEDPVKRQVLENRVKEAKARLEQRLQIMNERRKKNFEELRRRLEKQKSMRDELLLRLQNNTSTSPRALIRPLLKSLPPEIRDQLKPPTTTLLAPLEKTDL